MENITFPEARQKELTPFLNDLNKVFGISTVQQDDWDSSSITVHIGFVFDKRTNVFLSKPVAIRSAIKKIAKKHGINIALDDLPKKQYSYSGRGWDNKPEYYFKGYDKTGIGLSVFV